MMNWFTNVDKLVNTCPIGRNTASGNYGVFLNDMIKTQHDDFIVVLWNELENHGGNVMGMSESATPGDVNVTESSFGKKNIIPGYPSYFWFIPEYECVIQVVIKGLAPGRSKLKDFMEGYLGNKSKYCVLDSDDRIIGFSQNGKDEPNAAHRFPQFVPVRIAKIDVLDDILANRPKITRVIKKEKLSFKVARQKDIIEKFFSGLGTDGRQSSIEDRVVTHSLEYAPSTREIKAMYQRFLNKKQGDNLLNVGFRLSSGKTLYFAKEYQDVETEINLSKTKNQIISAAELEAVLIKRRTDLLKVLK
jgi:hypothetical protein